MEAAQPNGSPVAQPAPPEPLTPAELRVLKLLPTSTYLQMADVLYVSRNTVKTDRRGSIYQKLGVESRPQAIEPRSRTAAARFWSCAGTRPVIAQPTVYERRWMTSRRRPTIRCMSPERAAIVGELGAEGGRVRAGGDLAVVDCAQRSVGLAEKRI